MPLVDEQARHLTRTAFHRVAHKEQVQNRVRSVSPHPTMLELAGAAPQTGQTRSPMKRRLLASSKAAARVKCTCRAAPMKTCSARLSTGILSLRTDRKSTRLNS